MLQHGRSDYYGNMVAELVLVTVVLDAAASTSSADEKGGSGTGIWADDVEQGEVRQVENAVWLDGKQTSAFDFGQVSRAFHVLPRGVALTSLMTLLIFPSRRSP
jgi:hypothetical protein